MRLLVIDDNLAGQRLDKLLANRWPEQSRSEWQKRIEAGSVLVNGQIVKAHYQLIIGDKLKIVPLSRSATLTRATKLAASTEAAAKAKLKIIATEPDFLVVNKPAGLLVHDNVWPPRRPTVAAAIAKKYPAILSLGDSAVRPGIVHRLDKDVSGLMVIPRTVAMFAYLKRQFQYRTVKKCYTALVYGVLSKSEGVINFNLGRSSDGRKMAARPANQEGKAALTEYEVIRQWQNYSLLKVVIKTGRTHQIRAHLAAIDHPLVGDDWYGTNKTKLKNKELNLGRVFLVASELSFLDLQKKRRKFTIRLPKQLNDLLKQIK
ncbi:MAG TPA: RluA family pseudouridine synthase [bacterium]|jgi:23S rRNA pseudouridine1911/1915/1917 synthase|nr:RluA family pseudouridine synthase [bacterium]HNZ51675.1 RluA family pseudouridine synthase [bacterium]HOH85242.1 RluA family pseudouridine synthase [bacterium]HPW44265.1 RluA family pseudouridine synthase [bacterium]HPX64369.1 RluA family pseudouridine synthase [bacterium]